MALLLFLKRIAIFCCVTYYWQKERNGNFFGGEYLDARDIWVYTLEDYGTGIVVARNENDAKAMVIAAYSDCYPEFNPIDKKLIIKNAVENKNAFSLFPNVVEVF